MIPKNIAYSALPLLLTALAAPSIAADKPAPAEKEEAKKDDSAVAPVEEQAMPSRASVTVAGKLIHYTATPGTLTIRNDAGEPIASMFYTAYVADRAKGAKERPVTFLFNGGPGSSTMWLHVGSFGPVRVDTPTPDTARPAPFAIGPNPDSLIDRSDLVFIDAIGTGLSRPLGKAQGKDFWGVDPDIDAFASAIQRYLTINNRWNAPKFLLGESYGTLRSGALAYQLQERGMALNGVVLLSSIMNYGYRQPGLDQVYLNYLPSYAATAWYHNRLTDRPADVATVVAQARAFAVGPYMSALAKGQSISPQERDQIAEQMSRLIGLSPAKRLSAWASC